MCETRNRNHGFRTASKSRVLWQRFSPESAEALIFTDEFTHFAHPALIWSYRMLVLIVVAAFHQGQISPEIERRSGVSLTHQSASTRYVNASYTIDKIKKFVDRVKDIKSEGRYAHNETFKVGAEKRCEL